MSSSAERRAFKLGWAAFHQDAAMNCNPFIITEERAEWQAWREGYLVAKTEDDQHKDCS